MKAALPDKNKQFKERQLQVVIKKQRKNQAARKLKKCIKNKLFSLQHQTLHILRKASTTSKPEKFRKEKKKKKVESVKSKSHKTMSNMEGKVRKVKIKERLSDEFESITTSLENLLESPEDKRDEPVINTDVSVSYTNIIGTKIYFHQFTKTKVLLSMIHPCSLFFCGALEIQVLAGKIDVLGSIIEQNSGTRTVYSPRGLCHLSITTKEAGAFDVITTEQLLMLGVDESTIGKIQTKLGDQVVIMILEKDHSLFSSVVMPHLIDKYADVKISTIISTDNKIEKTLNCIFSLDYGKDNTKLFRHKADWDFIVKLIQEENQKVVLCGGKGVGKSTLLRYLINRSLPTWKKVLVIDLDPGQSEFMVPGCISVFLINTPLLGPSFTHTCDPIRSIFLGDCNPVPYYNYVSGFHNMIKYCTSQDEFKGIPWLVNTMGFCKGFGIILTSTIIKDLNPSIVIQIEGEDKSQNYPSHLTPKFVEANLYRNIELQKVELNYKFLTIDSAVSKSQTKSEQNLWGLAATTLRKIMILSYFGKLLSESNNNIFAVDPYMTDISSLNMSIAGSNITSKSSILDVINGSLVALCERSDEYEQNDNCLGFGIVRAVHKETGKFYILTPLSQEKLQDVNSIVKGNILLPDSLYTNPTKTVRGHVPYVSLSFNFLSERIRHPKKFPKLVGKTANGN